MERWAVWLCGFLTGAFLGAAVIDYTSTKDSLTERVKILEEKMLEWEFQPAPAPAVLVPSRPGVYRFWERDSEEEREEGPVPPPAPAPEEEVAPPVKTFGELEKQRLDI